MNYFYRSTYGMSVALDVLNRVRVDALHITHRDVDCPEQGSCVFNCMCWNNADTPVWKNWHNRVMKKLQIVSSPEFNAV